MNRPFFLFLNVLVIATCGLVYELLAAAVASYLLGDSILQFSTVIGVYLFAMGVGSFLSRYITRGVVLRFIQKLMLNGTLFLIFAVIGLIAWVERDDLKDCADTCKCKVVGFDVEIPADKNPNCPQD